MFLRRILIVIITIFLSVGGLSADYSLSGKDKAKVDKVAIVLNDFIEENGEKYRRVLILKIRYILKNKKLSDRVEAIYEYLIEGIKPEVIIRESETKFIDTDSSLYDRDEVRNYWLGLLNGVRNKDGLSLYKYDSSLDYTSQIWSNLSKSKGYIDHKIDVGDSYYDYWKKQGWMEDNGVLCKNINRITFSESIAWGQFYCNSSDCTAGVKKVMDSTFAFYYGEKGKSYKPHYEAMINPYFGTIGLGLSIKSLGNNKYTLYLTNHYCTENDI